MIKKMTVIKAIALALLGSGAMADMQGLDDEMLDSVQGQASLFSVDYIAPGGANPNPGIGFYRLGLDAEMQMNANIKRLALGCGGVKGAGCDIDVADVRLTGIGGTSASDSGPPTSAILTRPFFEFAIRNPSTAASREVVGIRFGSEQALGRMSIGSNPNTSNAADDSGITTFSGDMNAVIQNARIQTICIGIFTQGACDLTTGATLDPYDYAALHGQPLVFNRGTTMLFDGLTGTADLFGLAVNSTLTENLRFIHDLGIADGSGNPVRGFYLSVQKEGIRWQKVDGITNPFQPVSQTAQQGWWMSIPQVTINQLVITQTIYTTLGAALATVNLSDIDLAQVPADNCYGSLTFC